MNAAPPRTTASPEPVARATEVDRGTSLWHDAWLRLRRNRLAVFGACALIVLTIACIVGPWISSHTYRDMTGPRLAPPSFEHWFGTDQAGRDLFVRTMVGGRIALAVGLCATIVSLTIGVTWGAIAGYHGGKLDAVMMRIVEIVYSFPFTILVILLLVFTDSIAERYNLGATWNLVILFAAIGAVEWLTMARIVRGQIMALRRQEFIEAAYALGFRRTRIIFRHMLPNALGPIIVYTTLTIPAVMLLEAFLSYLGLGVQAPMSSWGTLIKEGASQMEEHPWLLVFPGAIFSLTQFSLNFLGDGLRDALDVRAAKD